MLWPLLLQVLSLSTGCSRASSVHVPMRFLGFSSIFGKSEVGIAGQSISGSLDGQGERCKLERLQTWSEELRHDITESIAEVETAFSESRSVLKGKYLLPLVGYREGNLTLFSYCQLSLKVTDLQDFLVTLKPPTPPRVSFLSAEESFLTSEECSTPACSLLPTFSATHLSFYNFSKRKQGSCIPLQHQLNINHFSLYAVVDQSRVFASGGCSHSAYLVHTSGQVEVCPSYKWRHSLGGIVVCQSAIYLFGSDK